MRLAIISDTHFGDDTCALITKDNSGNFVPGSKFDTFVGAAGTGNDYLVLAGDVFDFSISSYEQAYAYGQVFFQAVKKKNIANEIIYLPGNHDGDIWHIIQHQRSVINRLVKGRMPVPFDHSVAGIIDDRSNSSTKGFWLNKTTARTSKGAPKYGEMYLDYITGTDEKGRTTFNIAYPNLYIVTDKESVLVTHGQYLEPYWSLLGEIAMKIAYDDLKVGEVDVEEMVEMNFPLNQLACTGLGQAGVLTNVVRQMELDVKNGDLNRVTRYLDRLEKEIDDLTDYGWLKEVIVDYLLRKAKKEVLGAIGSMEKTRYSEEFIYKKDVQEKFRKYYGASLLEIGAINEAAKRDGIPGDIPAPWRVIFGHTHQPIPWAAQNAPKLDTVSSASPRRLTLHNTGGWIMNDGKFCGAEVFLYDTKSGFSSTSILS